MDRLSWLALTMVMLPLGCVHVPWRGIDVDPVNIRVLPASNTFANASGSGESTTWQGRVSAVGRALPDLPATTLQLPAVSPDGRWIAFLEDDPDQPPATPESAITGNGIEHVRLRLRSLEAEGAGEVIATGVAWPSWSDDGSALLFVNYDAQGVAYIGLHDPDEGMTQLAAVGLRRMMMPRLSPDGQTVAVIAYNLVPDQAQLFVVDLATRQATPGPTSVGGAQLLPRWVSDEALVFVELAGAPDAGEEDRATLRAWRRGGGASVELAELVAPDNIFDAQLLLAGVQRPLRPGGGAFALFEPAMGQVTLVELATGQRLPTLPRSVAGAWYGPEWFVAAGPQDVRMLHLPDPLDVPDAGRLQGVRLFDGQWAPLLADPNRQGLVLMGRSDDPTRRSLTQLWLQVNADE
ncbi:MAG: hypothetical protein AAF823_04970 [Planctomycetota bacterium]